MSRAWRSCLCFGAEQVALTAATLAVLHGVLGVRQPDDDRRPTDVCGFRAALAVVAVSSGKPRLVELEPGSSWPCLQSTRCWCPAFWPPGSGSLLVGRIGAVKAATFHFLNPFFGVAIAVAAYWASALTEACDFIGVAIITCAASLPCRSVASKRPRDRPCRNPPLLLARNIPAGGLKSGRAPIPAPFNRSYRAPLRPSGRGAACT